MKNNLKLLDRIEEYVMDALIVLMFVTVLAQIVSRYIFNSPLLFTEELSMLAFLWIVMLGTGYCFKNNLHTRITLLTDLLPLKIRGIVDIIINTICAAGMIFFFWPALRFTITQSAVRSPVLPISMAVKYASFVVACVLIIVRTTQASVKMVGEKIGECEK